MTVRDAVRVLKTADKIVLGYGANAVEFDPKDPLHMDAYGMYIVDAIRSDDGKYYEVSIAMHFVKADS